MRKSRGAAGVLGFVVRKCQSFVEAIGAIVQTAMSSPKMMITYLWMMILAVNFMFALSAIVLAANNDYDHPPHLTEELPQNGTLPETDNVTSHEPQPFEASSSSRTVGFLAIWYMLMNGALAFGGTLVLRKYHRALAVGFMIGVVVCMACVMFGAMITFISQAKKARIDVEVYHRDGAVHSNEASAVFSCFLWMLYVAFAFVVMKYRHEVFDWSNDTATNVPKAGDRYKPKEQAKDVEAGNPSHSVMSSTVAAAAGETASVGRPQPARRTTNSANEGEIHADGRITFSSPNERDSAENAQHGNPFDGVNENGVPPPPVSV